jgi:hypothetical protein
MSVLHMDIKMRVVGFYQDFTQSIHSVLSLGCNFDVTATLSWDLHFVGENQILG